MVLFSSSSVRGLHFKPTYMYTYHKIPFISRTQNLGSKSGVRLTGISMAQSGPNINIQKMSKYVNY